MTTYQAPQIRADEVTPSLVRDELLNCFGSANREFLSVLNQPYVAENVKTQVRAFVSGVFQNCGASFEHPTKSGIVTAIAQCKANAQSMMGPAGSDIIDHHYSEMIKLVDQLPDD